MALESISTVKVDKQEFSELVVTLLEDFVHGDTSPFKDVKSILEDYLDQATGLDSTQKAGVFSDWLKESYSSINKQVMSTAADILKTNAQLALERYSTESGYNLQVAQEAKVRAEIDALGVETEKREEEKKILTQKLHNDKVAYLNDLAKLDKQFGFPNATTSAMDVDTGLLKFPTLGTSSGKGAVDKQIAGYTLLNYKDMLKTMDEKAALMMNAKFPETLYQKTARVELMYEISRLDGSDTNGFNYTVFHNGAESGDADAYYTYTPGVTPFSGHWTSVTTPVVLT